MNKKQSQLGSAHVVVIVLLVVALMGTLGFVYWQNFMQQKVSDTTKTVTTDTTVLLDKSVTENVTGSNLTLNYPSDWIVASSTSLNPNQVLSNERLYITSPDTNVKVSLWAGIDGIGGMCDPATAGTFSNVNTYPLSNYSGYTLYEVITSVSMPITEVHKDNNEIQVNKSTCELGLGVFDAKNKTTNKLSISFENGLSFNLSNNIDSARATDNYKTAVKIVQSLHEK